MKHTQIQRQECNTVVKSSLKNQNVICGHTFKELEYSHEYHGSGTELSNRIYTTDNAQSKHTSVSQECFEAVKDSSHPGNATGVSYVICKLHPD
jgi:hypothetical protein